MPARAREPKPPEEAGFVFMGTVRKLGASTMRGLAVGPRTAVVRVDDILQAPAALRGFKGQEITVELGGRSRMRSGEQAVFYTNPVRYGESIAVQSVGQRAVGAIPAASAAAVDPVQTLAARQAERRAASADLVVTGRVRSVRVPEEESGHAVSALAAKPPTDFPISEHDPMWQEAVVDVAEVEKGEPVQTVTVRFPSSRDVRWVGAPKFRPGDEGRFILHRGERDRQAAPLAGARLVAPLATAEYTALHPADFEPLQALSNVHGLTGVGGAAGPVPPEDARPARPSPTPARRSARTTTATPKPARKEARKVAGEAGRKSRGQARSGGRTRGRKESRE